MTPAENQLEDFLFRHTSDGVIILSRAGLVEAANPAFAHMFQLGDLELVGISAQMLFEDNPPLLSLITAPDDQSSDLRLLDQRRVRVTVSTFDRQRVALFQDAAAEQSDLSTLRTKFARVTAHDLRNPIAALIGFSALLETSGQLDDEHKQYLARVQDISSKLHYAVGDLVELAWVEAGMPMQHGSVDLNAAALNAIQSLDTLTRERGITITTSLQEPILLVNGDSEQLSVVIRKLLHNALLYLGDGKSVSLATRSEAGEVFCTVTDDGIGIDAEELDTIFDRFYRSRDPRIKEIPGGGLGLTIARKLLRHYGGDLTVASQSSQGSTFTLRLPTLSTT